ncbi:MAG: hypothetical protein XD85_0409 [Parcubacteria bacterium 34_609]|nr:MAG: hypothetical protein XD85_0409 [Parcubacteria bacterium 34_609]
MGTEEGVATGVWIKTKNIIRYLINNKYNYFGPTLA